MIKAFIFDFDGTLIDSNGLKRDAFYVAASIIPGADVHIDRIFSSDEDPGDRYDVMKALSKVPESPGEDIFDKLIDRYARYCEEKITSLLESSNMPVMFDILRKRGFLVFINTSTPSSAIEAVLDAGGWIGHFDGIYCGHNMKVENLNKIMREHDMDVPEVVLIGDGDPDVAAARKVGCKFIKVDDGPNALFHKTAEGASEYLFAQLGI